MRVEKWRRHIEETKQIIMNAEQENEKEIMKKLNAIEQVSFKANPVLFELVRELKLVLCFKPLRKDAVALFLKLLTWLEEDPKSDIGRLYKRPEWKELMGLRGIAENIVINKCTHCNKEYVGIGISAYIGEVYAYICDKCGNVFFGNDSKDPLPKCECGGTYCMNAGCPFCGAYEQKTVQYISPYEYFSNHSFQKGF